MGILPMNTPMEFATGWLTRGAVRASEAKLDKVAEVGEPLSTAARASAAATGTTFLVSGFGGSTKGLGPIARSLTRDGINNVRVQIPGGGLDGVRDGVAALDTAIAENARTGDIHLAGHSKGGIIIQEWYRTATEAQRSRVASMTLLASTHVGQGVPAVMDLPGVEAWTSLWTGPLSSSIAEAQARNPVMRRLAELDDLPSRLRVTSVISKQDGLIKRPEAYWSGANNVVITGADAPDHMHTLVDARAYGVLRDNIMGS